MAVYVDEIQRWPSGPWCHMMSDGPVAELHQFARAVGIPRCYYEGARKGHPHYDLRPKWRALAVAAGAIELPAVEMVKRCSLVLRKLSKGD